MVKRPRPRTRAVAAVSAAVTGVAGLALMAPGVGTASSHREAPYIAGQPRVDNTDVYAFVSPDKPDMVTLIANWYPFQEPNGGPIFYQFEAGARYDINVDANGDARPDLTYRWVFRNHLRNKNTFLFNTGPVTSLTDPDLNFFQTYDLYRIRHAGSNGYGASKRLLVDNGLVAPSFVGPASMPNGYAPLRREATRSAMGNRMTYAGQADDPFFADLRVFDLLYGAEIENGRFVESGNDTLAGYNVQTIALQVPKKELALNHKVAANPVIGVWSDTERRRTMVQSRTNGRGGARNKGRFAQVSRLGNPLVNEVVIPFRDKDRFNASTPRRDAQFLRYVQNPEVPRLVEAIYGIPAPATPRTDLVEVFLTGVCAKPGCPPTVNGVNLNSQLLNRGVDPARFRPSEMLRLNMSVPPSRQMNRLGVIGGDLAGFPNGRRLGDDVVDIELQVLEGELLGRANDIGDAVSRNDKPFTRSFPYVGIPHSDAVNQRP